MHFKYCGLKGILVMFEVFTGKLAQINQYYLKHVHLRLVSRRIVTLFHCLHFNVSQFIIRCFRCVSMAIGVFFLFIHKSMKSSNNRGIGLEEI